MNKVQLVYQGMSQLVSSPEIGLLVLSDNSQTRHLAIVCDSRMEYEMGLRTNKEHPTNKLLPEVLCTSNPFMNGNHYEILFNSIIGGEYKALLVNKDDLSLTPIRASDAILLSTIAKLDIFMEERLFKRQSVEGGSLDRKMAIPVNALSVEMLSQALKKAIEDENYELASMLRDELKQRGKSQKKD